MPNGFLFAASSLGLPPRPLKNPPPAFVPLALAGLEPKTLPPDGGCCCCCKRVNNNMHKKIYTTFFSMAREMSWVPVQITPRCPAAGQKQNQNLKLKRKKRILLIKSETLCSRDHVQFLISTLINTHTHQRLGRSRIL